MIIKKKYTNIKKITEETKAAEELFNLADDIVSPESAVLPDSSEAGDTDHKPEQNSDNKKDFDLTLENIKFEQREERREGTRRRGYRRTEDRNIISRAQTEAVSIKEAAKQEGYKEGISKAETDIAELKSKIEEFCKYKEEVYTKVSDCILDIAVEIARKIINKEVETDRETTISIIKGAVEEINKTENKITLKVMPKDVEIVKDKVPEIFSQGGIDAKISVIPDSSIKEGGVIVETSNGLIDASIETQLAIIEKALVPEKEDK